MNKMTQVEIFLKGESSEIPGQVSLLGREAYIGEAMGVRNLARRPQKQTNVTHFWHLTEQWERPRHGSLLLSYRKQQSW